MFSDKFVSPTNVARFRFVWVHVHLIVYGILNQLSVVLINWQIKSKPYSHSSLIETDVILVTTTIDFTTKERFFRVLK